METNDKKFISDEAIARQQKFILLLLSLRPHSSIELREQFGIVHPAGRVHELRKRGYCIVTDRTYVFDSCGREHQCAVYTLERRAGWEIKNA